MQLEYMDNPHKVEEWIETLSDNEREIFDKGYVLALHGVLEQITESRHVIEMKLMEHKEEKGPKIKQLLSRLVILDSLEKHYTERVNQLTQEPA